MSACDKRAAVKKANKYERTGGGMEEENKKSKNIQRRVSLHKLYIVGVSLEAGLAH